jgi:two-component SAPR family response regulator
LGKTRVELDGKVVQWPAVQSRDMFFCLLQHPEGLSKEEIGEAFWPEHSSSQMHNIFRSTLYRLRRALFREIVVLEADLYSFNRQSDYWFDVEVFERLLDQSEEAVAAEKKIALLQEALELYRGDYLGDTDAEWCTVDRERLKERYLKAMETLAALHTDQGTLQPAIELYQRVLAHDPYRESVYRDLMLCYYRLGDRASAIRQYQICTNVLRTELGLAPSPETAKLFLKIIG